jgi:hypothetical protein
MTTDEQKINEFAINALATLSKVIHAIQHSNMKGTILHQEITACVKQGMEAPLRIPKLSKTRTPYKKNKTQSP